MRVLLLIFGLILNSRQCSRIFSPVNVSVMFQLCSMQLHKQDNFYSLVHSFFLSLLYKCSISQFVKSSCYEDTDEYRDKHTRYGWYKIRESLMCRWFLSAFCHCHHVSFLFIYCIVLQHFNCYDLLSARFESTVNGWG